MKLSKKKIIQILKDAERDFRLEPDDDLNNSLGLCDYIEQHKTMRNISEERFESYLTEILGNKKSKDTFTFCHGYSQRFAYSENLGKYDRADWCKERIKDYE